MTDLLVTGAGGFIGRSLVRRLSAERRTTALSRQLPDPGAASTGAAWVQGDFTQPDVYARLPDRMDAVVHVAALSDVREAEARPAEAFRVNGLGTLLLLEYAKRARAQLFVYISTGSVYRPRREPFTEDTAVEPPNTYAFTKHVGEQMARRYEALFPVAILRLFHPYGPGQQDRKLVPALAEKIRRGDPLVTHPGDRPLLSLIYIDDLVEAVGRVLQRRPCAVLNVAGSRATIPELGKLIGECVGREPRFVTDNSPAENEAADTALMTKTLGFQPAVDLAEGLGRTLGRAGSRDA